MKRSYHQFCGLAVALDTVAERWALLIIRDLAPGPRRFTDLFAGLPGIATDVLADRLRSLELVGAVEQTTTSHPAPAKLYQLTERGQDLARISGELALWGMPLLPANVTKTYRSDARWALQSMTSAYRGGLPSGNYRLTVDDHDLTISINRGKAQLSYGHADAAHKPVFAVQCSKAQLFAMIRRPPTDANWPASIVASGRTQLLGPFFAAMPLRPRAAAGGRESQTNETVSGLGP